MSDEKHPPTLEHQEPPVYYCWKYWMSNGEIREGCTPMEPDGHDTWPDLNDYGWVYIAVPVSIVFVIIFIMYLICSKAGSNNKSTPKKSILLEESDSEDDEPPPPKSNWSRVRSYYPETERAISYKKPVIEDFATVVHMAKPDNMSAPDRKAASRNGVPQQGRVYPQLSKISRGPRADEEVAINGKRMHSKPTGNGPAVPPLNHYINDPTGRKNKPTAPPTRVAEETSSEDDSDVNTQSEEENEE